MDDFVRDNGPDVSNLAMNFYLKASEREQRGFEFTHKSFGEYLTARALLSVAISVIDLVDRRIDHALTEWVSATRSGASTIDILQFLRDEVRLITDNGADHDALLMIKRLKKAFVRIAQAAVDDGLPTLIGSQTWRQAEAEQANSEAAVWCVLNSCAKLIALADIGSC